MTIFAASGDKNCHTTRAKVREKPQFDIAVLTIPHGNDLARRLHMEEGRRKQYRTGNTSFNFAVPQPGETS
jgi:hypothetical protein